MKYHENVDFISDMSFVEHKKTLLATGGDGCLSIFDIRKSKPVAVSENQDDELLCVEVVRNTTKAVVGTQDGVLLLFSWGDWGDCTDRFPGHPSSVDSIVKVDDSTIMTASGDGIIRAIGILPNRLVGAVGDHGDMPIERIRLTRDGTWVGTCSHDSTVRFWSVEEALREDEEDEVAEEQDLTAQDNGDKDKDDQSENEDDAVGNSTIEASPEPIGSKRTNPNASSDEDSSDEETKERQRKKKPKKAKRGIGGVKKANAAFFADID
ncbi:uncharacterized protein SPPG_03228 [Spizellomyces punctatus DAOM BR117]|uniref:WD repeat-containing protein JIP5 n=1 Tax=Spizellomyces punctatus (strain DAOM BR117) TaxID=645134 RepID=A0A0L0HK64_SPIPD|nr:uncharacterized protein SPPG_03228 [Spizellomyces punctatus DAOM BR117]KND01423.1 hypothetical protein SPPG_03228 [Spizellomyces punctatus DAOM BR117]|eukprot:XP_016609462.1 hypothetical protein SPPG_03228 [Spizellomyces punctatus DAOM BR117]